jgi:GNAT superfamily N-acetyltransferase
MAAELTFRPARAEDREAAARICARTWDWGDYIPEVWDAWLADERGYLAVAELEGQIAALGRVRLLSGGQAWLEGMRVDPGYRRQGIAWRFVHHKLDYARAHGARVARLGTSDQNQPVHRMMERAGMERVGRYEMLSAPALPGSKPSVPLTPQDARPVRTFLQRSVVLAAARGLCSLDWAWETLSEARAAELLAAGQMVGQWGSAGDLAALAVVQQEPDDERLWVGFAAAGPAVGPRDGPAAGPQAGPAARPLAGADAGALRAFAQALRAQAHHWALNSAVAMLPDLPPVRKAFRAAGYGPAEWEGEIWIYEMALDPYLPGEDPEADVFQNPGSVAWRKGNGPETTSTALRTQSAVAETGT